MKYLDKSFSVPPPAKVTACEKCVYGSGEHAEWCGEAVFTRLLREHYEKAEKQSAMFTALLKSGRVVPLNPAEFRLPLTVRHA